MVFPELGRILMEHILLDDIGSVLDLQTFDMNFICR